MERYSSLSSPVNCEAPLKVPSAAGFGLVTLTNASSLQAQFLPNGALFALRHGSTLINQLLPGPAEDGLLRLFLRIRDTQGVVSEHSALTGAGLNFVAGADFASWTAKEVHGLSTTTTFSLHPSLPAWAWRVRVTNKGTAPVHFDVLMAQDLGLADEGAVRNCEAYVSQYIDLLPLSDGRLGWVLLARQNQAAAGGRHPWLALACENGASAFCTDGWQFFGVDHRLTGTPAALGMDNLPSKRLQYEFALGGLQSRSLGIPAGASVDVLFLSRFSEDHPGASEAGDLESIRKLIPASWALHHEESAPLPPAQSSLFITTPWLSGRDPSEQELARFHPGPWRNEERDAKGTLLSFFCDRDTHVVTKAKEARILRPHGHILRSGDGSWIDGGQMGVTGYASGVFASQAYFGNPSFAKLLPVARNALNVCRAGGLRLFVRRSGVWYQLGVPSAFSMTPSDMSWLYLLNNDLSLEVRVWCPVGGASVLLDLRVLSGGPCEILATHQLAASSTEFERDLSIVHHKAEGWCSIHPSQDSLVGQKQPSLCFAIAAQKCGEVAAFGGGELLASNAEAKTFPYLAIQSRPVFGFGIILLGTQDGTQQLPALVEDARQAFAKPASRLVQGDLRLGKHKDPGVERINEILPWFHHNAAIHFSAPHGLEQTGGAAWGVRDVCQGSVEWVLTTGRHDIARKLLSAVFSQQYRPESGAIACTWPQWFMHAPYREIQQAHSHGDVCLWPMKALCDYAEAANDMAFLDTELGYTDPETFTDSGPVESLWLHCDRIVDHCEARFVEGTALINYGDGDWDDTLQPADPSMRTRMISAWTVALSYHCFRQLAELSRRAGHLARAARLESLLERMKSDFSKLLMPDGIVAGFLLADKSNTFRPLLHPSDRVTGIRYRLLPMTRGILSHLFTPAQAAEHLEIIRRALLYPDGARLMSEPAVYSGGLERLFKRADSAANVGREIGLQYVHAHLRYAEAMATLGEANALWTALQVVTPVGIKSVVPQAGLRQSNVYFSSSDANFDDRYEASRRWPELRSGTVEVRGGWRLYSSGPGLYLNKVRGCLLGLRESFEDFVFDPVLPDCLDGLTVETSLGNRACLIVYRVIHGVNTPKRILVNGTELDVTRRTHNPFRTGGVLITKESFCSHLRDSLNQVEIDL